jgi:vanillate O-demethylase monooxygenase subunit
LTRLESTLWPALRNYWHPVAVSTAVLDEPEPVTLLDEKLVLFRLDGKVACFHDLCIHRGTPLSLGWVEGCGWHSRRKTSST